MLPFPTLSDALSSLLSDESRRRDLFPIATRQIFLAHAGVAPLPAAVYQAVERQARLSTTMEQEGGGNYRVGLSAARAAAAPFVDARPDEVALLGPTSLGLSLVAHGLDWKPGDEVVFYPDDYPANVYPWRDLARFGVRPVSLQPTRLGAITPELVQAALTPKTRLVAVASAHFLSGDVLDLRAVADCVHNAGALLCLDAIQTIGAVPQPFAAADFIAADSHKWMLGPLAAGLLVVRRHVQSHLRPALLGAENVRTRHFIAAESVEPIDDAPRYEPGAMNLLGIAGMRAGLELIDSFDRAAVASRITRAKLILLEALRPHRFEFLHPDPASLPGGILTFRHPTVPAATLFARLNAQNIVASHRWTRDGREWIRFSPHFYNSDAELQSAAACVIDALAP